MQAKTVLSVVTHVVALSLYTRAVIFDYSLEDKLPACKTFAGRWKHLTWWNLWFQIFYFLLSMINDIFGSNAVPDKKDGEKSTLQSFRDHFLISVAWPMGTFVVLVFWALYFVDRDLIHPEELDKIIPPWHNHACHTYVIFFLIIELVGLYHDVPKRRIGITFTMLVAVVYIAWIFFIAFYADLWVYPVLEVLSWPGRLAFIGGLVGILTMIYIVGEQIVLVSWGESVSMEKLD